jgi:hypothetical protein
MDPHPKGADADDEASARAALTAYVFSQEKAALEASLPHLAGFTPHISASIPSSIPSFGEAAALESGIGDAALPRDRLATAIVYQNAAAGTDDAARQQQRAHKQNQILQRTFGGHK